MPDLSSVTLCAVDCANPLLALRALDLCARQCRFAEVLFLSDSVDRYQLAGCRIELIPRIGSRAEYSRFILKELGRYCRTEHLLLVQWDGYIINPDAWRPEFLEYDYIGAPWGWYQDGHRVGNGGFSLRSRRLLEALLDEAIVDLDPEDEAIGRRYRTLLESKHGIRFAPEEMASEFSFETTYPKGRPFGFHGLFNMWMVIPPQDLADFVATLGSGSVSGPQFLRLGQNYLELGRRQEAAIVLKRRMEVTPADAEAQRLLALATQAVQQPSAGSGSRAPGRNEPCPCGSGKRYKQCCGSLGADRSPASPVQREPGNAEAGLLQAAMARHQAGRLDDAEALYRQTLQANPANAVAQQYLGVLAMQRGNPVQGEALIREALATRPDIPDFHNNLGLCLRLQNRLDEAVLAYRQAIALNPDYAVGHNNLGLDLQALGQVQEARKHFEQALALQPQFAEAHWNLGLACLALGDLARGWAEYEWRLRCQPFVNDGLVLAGVPAWQGQPLAGKTLLVRREQGAGDTLQFLRFVPELIRRGARVLVDVTPDLAELAGTVAPAVELVDRAAPLPPVDYYINLMSLPYRLGITLDNLPSTVPYLRPDAARVAAWQARLASFPGQRIGLVWAGNPKHKNDHNRSCPLAALQPLFGLPDVAWFSLQKGEHAKQLAGLPHGHITDLGAELNSFADTAAALQALDLLITVDTSVAHLAGALGRPAWVLLPYAPDWRWMLERDDSPWYPSLHLFRQRSAGDWVGVIERLRQRAGDLCVGS